LLIFGGLRIDRPRARLSLGAPRCLEIEYVVGSVQLCHVSMCV
jgi:hypothetical protein